MRGPLIIADKCSIWLTARGAKLVLVNLFEELALVELDGAGQVAIEVALGDVQHAQLEAGASLAIHHQVVEPAKGSFKLHKTRMMHDGVKLCRKFFSESSNCSIESP